MHFSVIRGIVVLHSKLLFLSRLNKRSVSALCMSESFIFQSFMNSFDLRPVFFILRHVYG
jgi:hypothetical protein